MHAPDGGAAADRRAAWERRWRDLASTRSWKARALLPLAWLYGLLVAARHRLYSMGWLRSERLPVPVLVVGNLVAGGAGKTPATIALVQHLRQSGWTPGVISRGHGSRSVEARAVTPRSGAADVGDEPLLIARRTAVPVFVAARRAEAGHALLSAHPEVDIVVCDDGIQHRALHANVRLAVFDDRGVGNGWLLPAGLLREPWPPRGAQPLPDLLWQQSPHGTPAFVEGCGQPVWRVGRRLAPEAVAADGRRRPLADLSGIPVRAVAGIARPEAFFDMLRQAGVAPVLCIAMPDHADTAILRKSLEQSGDLPVLCTEKDLVKLTDLQMQAQVWAVPLELDIPADALAALDARLSAYHPAHGHQTA